MSPPLRVVFFGTPEFAVPTLQALIASQHRVVLVVTQPDRPRGRGQTISPGPVRQCADAASIPVVQPETLRDPAIRRQLESLAWDLGVVAAYGRLLPSWLLALPRLGLINVHASLLPRYRGASPIHHAVMHGDPETGVTIMRVVQALDAGAMLATVRVPIGPHDSTADVEPRLASAGASLLVDTVDRLAEGPVDEVAQDDASATYAPRITKDRGLIDWSQSAQAIHNLIRGLTPWPRASTSGPRGRLIMHASRVEEASHPEVQPGTILTASPHDGLTVATGEGTLRILALQSEGGRVLEAPSFLSGHPLPPGTRLGTT
jgi:methionyl-tRNA formyltransferase